MEEKGREIHKGWLYYLNEEEWEKWYFVLYDNRTLHKYGEIQDKQLNRPKEIIRLVSINRIHRLTDNANEKQKSKKRERKYQMVSPNGQRTGQWINRLLGPANKMKKGGMNNESESNQHRARAQYRKSSDPMLNATKELIEMETLDLHQSLPLMPRARQEQTQLHNQQQQIRNEDDYHEEEEEEEEEEEIKSDLRKSKETIKRSSLPHPRTSPTMTYTYQRVSLSEIDKK
ncbi:YTH domain-containing protein 1, partial [Reticulomyxa filosa]